MRAPRLSLTVARSLPCLTIFVPLLYSSHAPSHFWWPNKQAIRYPRRLSGRPQSQQNPFSAKRGRLFLVSYSSQLNQPAFPSFQSLFLSSSCWRPFFSSRPSSSSSRSPPSLVCITPRSSLAYLQSRPSGPPVATTGTIDAFPPPHFIFWGHLNSLPRIRPFVFPCPSIPARVCSLFTNKRLPWRSRSRSLPARRSLSPEIPVLLPHNENNKIPVPVTQALRTRYQHSPPTSTFTGLCHRLVAFLACVIPLAGRHPPCRTSPNTVQR